MKQHNLSGISVVKPQAQPNEVSLQDLARIVEAQGAMLNILTQKVARIQRQGTDKDIKYGPIHGGDLL